MRKKQKIITLYNDADIYALKEIISITDEEDLNQFWEYVSASENSENPYLYAFLVSLYELATHFFSDSEGTFFEIILEQSNEAFYCTLWNRRIVEFIQHIWNRRNIEYRIRKKRITARLSKTALREKAYLNENERINYLLSPLSDRGEIRGPYRFMSVEDLTELRALAEDAGDYLGQALDIGITADVFIRIRSYFSLISVTLSYYEEIIQVASVMTEFSMMLNVHKEEFAALTTEKIMLIEGFVRNFQRWLQILFIDGGADVHFMDRSLRADMEMIRIMIDPGAYRKEENLESIFDF